jgi:hypothetical protein
VYIAPTIFIAAGRSYIIIVFISYSLVLLTDDLHDSGFELFLTDQRRRFLSIYQIMVKFRSENA